MTDIAESQPMSRTSRLFQLLSVLRARRRPATAVELARDLNVSKRSVYRDIETLRLLGAPIDGQAGIGFVLKDGFFLPHFAFSPEEIDALILGLGWVQQRGDPALVQSSDSALAKMLSARADGSQSSNELPPLFTAASVTERTDPPLVAPLRDAIRRQRKASIDYQDGSGALSSRIIWPIAIVYFDDVRVAAAWCETRASFRHFRVDRIRTVVTLEERYPDRRSLLIKRWRKEDRDWRLLLPVSGTALS